VELDVLAIAAHRDDLELRTGGTLIRLADMGYRVGALDLSAGEAGTSGDAEIRAREAADAAEVMGLAHRDCLCLPDGGIDSRDPAAMRGVVEAVRRHRPAILIAPYWETRHPDHRETSLLATDAAFFAGMKKFEAEGDLHRPNDVYYYMMRYRFEPSVIVDITETFDRKKEAVLAYRSQFHNPDQPRESDDETFISRPGFLEEIWAMDRYFGGLIRTDYGEPFLLRHPPEAIDPVQLAGSRVYY
jgi:bacillithiol biosynthesis deacetylase BshB1